jgi:small-conductance mechanosensitive channel
MPLVARALCFYLFSVIHSAAVWAGGFDVQKTSPSEVTTETALVVFNRNIVVFRSSFLGADPAKRAARARMLIEEVLREDGDLPVQVKSNPEGQLVVLNDRLVFVVTTGDADPLLEETAEIVAKRAAQRLEKIVAETREARNIDSMLKALAASGGATLVFAFLLFGLQRARKWLPGVLLGLAGSKLEKLKLGSTQIIDGRHLAPLLRRLLVLGHWFIVLLLTYEWVSLVLSRFPYTRPWGERLNDYLFGIAEGILSSALGAIPGLGVALIIFLLAYLFTGFLGRFIERLSHAADAVSWLSVDTMPTTRRLINIGIWLFAVAMAYPYLPGAHTDAFRGLSVLLGLMISLGASSIVGQGAAGLILTYTRTIRQGEYVRIGEHEGTVVEMGMFTTCIRTGLGEELTLPNSVITGTVTKNYSRAVKGAGYVIDTTVTIGYDTPWRQVEAMLIEAARQTPGILESPPPLVFQTALSDYYPEYRLVAQAVPSRPRPRAEVLTMLHASIQDVFNKYGVQIMSPHYIADPAEAKVVTPENWHPEPAPKQHG